MARETKAEKALRMIAERRLLVERVNEGLVVASCRGDDDLYKLGYDPHKREWRCTCEGYRIHPSVDCSHLLALKLVALGAAR